MSETIVHKQTSPIGHYPNWVFRCPDCVDSYYELPQDLPEIKELHSKGELPFDRSCGCKENNIHPETLRLKDVL